MFESPVKQNLQSPDGARRPAANYLDGRTNRIAMAKMRYSSSCCCV